MGFLPIKIHIMLGVLALAGLWESKVESMSAAAFSTRENASAADRTMGLASGAIWICTPETMVVPSFPTTISDSGGSNFHEALNRIRPTALANSIDSPSWKVSMPNLCPEKAASSTLIGPSWSRRIVLGVRILANSKVAFAASAVALATCARACSADALDS